MAKPAPTPTDVLAQYRAEADASPNSAEAHTNLGWGLYGRGQFDEAIQQFEKAIGLNGDLLDAYYGLALSSKKAARSGPAITAFEKARSLLANEEDKNRTQLMSKIIDTHLNALRSQR